MILIKSKLINFNDIIQVSIEYHNYLEDNYRKVGRDKFIHVKDSSKEFVKSGKEIFEEFRDEFDLVNLKD